MRVCTHQSRRLILRKSTCFVLFSRAAQRSTWKEQGVSWVTARRACLHHVVPVLVSNLHFFRSSLDGRVRHLIHRQNDDGLENDGAPRDEQIRSESQRVDKLQSAGSIRACGGRNDKILSGPYAGRNRLRVQSSEFRIHPHKGDATPISASVSSYVSPDSFPQSTCRNTRRSQGRNRKTAQYMFRVL